MTGLRTLVIAIILSPCFGHASAAETIPAESEESGTAPQFVFDQYVIDNHWAVKYKTETVRRVFRLVLLAALMTLARPVRAQQDTDWINPTSDLGVEFQAQGGVVLDSIAYFTSDDGISEIRNRMAYRCFAGPNEHGDPRWTAEFGERSPVFTGPLGPPVRPLAQGGLSAGLVTRLVTWGRESSRGAPVRYC